jgi:beta-glucosidase
LHLLNHHSDWPAIRSGIVAEPGIESAIADILAEMTVEEKLGQMIQPDLVELTSEDVRDYKIGSALNGAGRWPHGNRRATPAIWAETLSEFWSSAEEAYRDRPFRIPFMWGTDAVHGHNNVHGATIFPHNIGLGAARDPDLIYRIGRATAAEVVATGMDWTFAPTVAVPRDRRWGRTYEGYSEDPEIVHTYAWELVRGLQGTADDLRSDRRVLACAKHWLADGGTFAGEDRGTAQCSEDVLRNVHAAGFLSAIEAGVQTVMASYNGWVGSGRTEERLHGSEYLLTTVLKGKIGFDGIVVGDWDAHQHVPGCSEGDANNVIKAGLDILMISSREKWTAVHRTALAAIRSGDIPMSRIDDAVLRILRVKMRAGLWDKPRPQDRATAGSLAVLGNAEHRALAREAVRKSLVLLKNDNAALPIARTARVLVTGSAADAIQKQTGGYTVTWQGDNTDLTDYAGGSTVAMAVAEAVGTDRCVIDPYLEEHEPAEFDVALVAIGEDPYAEMMGSLRPWRTIEYARMKPGYARDRETLRRLREAGTTVVTVLFSGRPLYVTPEINASDAFVAAWLPGPDASGLTDVLFAGPDGTVAHEFQGRLSVSWPRGRRNWSANRAPLHLPDYELPIGEVLPAGDNAPLFEYGYGLTMGDGGSAVGVLPLDETPETPVPEPVDRIIDLGPGGAGYVLTVTAPDRSPRPIPLDAPLKTDYLLAEPAGEGAVGLNFLGTQTFVYARSADGSHRDLRGHVRDGRLRMALRVLQPPTGPFYLTSHHDHPQQPTVDIAPRLAALPIGEWAELEVPLADLAAAGIEFEHIDVPLMLHTEAVAHLELGALRLVTEPDEN